MIQVPRASTAVNIVQRVGGSIGTALVAVVLDHQIATRVHALAGGLSAASTASPLVLARVVQPLAAAFGATFWWVMAMTVVALVPALLLVRGPAVARGAAGPGRPPTPSEEPPASGGIGRREGRAGMIGV